MNIRLDWFSQKFRGRNIEMAVPKGKVSKARKNSRNSANFKAAAPTLTECPNCHEKKLSHVACNKCGMYKGQEVIAQKKEDKKK